ncbi:MAG: formimidoylglutamase [Chitinophagaceae bacterium]
MEDLHDFLLPINKDVLNNDAGYNDGQLAKHVAIFETILPDITESDIILVGVLEQRGGGIIQEESNAADVIRKKLYELYYWHPDIRIADIGNIRTGASLADSYAAIKTVMAELLRLKKTVILIGGTHDNTLAQYFGYKELGKIIEATCIDATIDLRGESNLRTENFLLEMLTGEPNLVKHYNHIGFQSYYVHPRLLETMDKLRFDCFRLGHVTENLEEVEPVLRNSNMVSIDVNAIKYSDAPSNALSANGFTGTEICTLTQQAGLSNQVSSLGIYGYNPSTDVNELTASQIAQMIWYFIDGKYRGRQEAAFEDKSNFTEYHCNFTELDTIFLQSKKTGRWWMQLPDKKMIACSYKDYMIASRNDIPERWLRALERG